MSVSFKMETAAWQQTNKQIETQTPHFIITWSGNARAHANFHRDTHKQTFQFGNYANLSLPLSLRCLCLFHLIFFWNCHYNYILCAFSWIIKRTLSVTFCAQNLWNCLIVFNQQHFSVYPFYLPIEIKGCGANKPKWFLWFYFFMPIDMRRKHKNSIKMHWEFECVDAGLWNKSLNFLLLFRHSIIIKKFFNIPWSIHDAFTLALAQHEPSSPRHTNKSNRRVFFLLLHRSVNTKGTYTLAPFILFISYR